MPAKKLCRKCGQLRQLDEMRRDRTRPDGYATICRDCHAARQRDYYARHSEQENKRTRAYRAANREQINERQRAYYAAHREQLNDRARDRDRARRADRRTQGICESAGCPFPTAAGSRRCVEHLRQDRLRLRARRMVRALVDYAASLGFEATISCGVCFSHQGTEVDHRVGLAEGGTNSWRNLRLVDHGCNMARPPEDDPVSILDQIASFASMEFAEAAAAYIDARLARRRAEAEHYDAVARRIAADLQHRA